MDVKIEKKKYLVPRKYWAWIGGAYLRGANQQRGGRHRHRESGG